MVEDIIHFLKMLEECGNKNSYITINSDGKIIYHCDLGIREIYTIDEFNNSIENAKSYKLGK